MFKTFRESALEALEEASLALKKGSKVEAEAKVRYALDRVGVPTPFREGTPDIAAARQLLEVFCPHDRTVYPTVEVGKAVVLEADSPTAQIIIRMAKKGVCAVAEDGTTFYAVEL